MPRHIMKVYIYIDRYCLYKYIYPTSSVCAPAGLCGPRLIFVR